MELLERYIGCAVGAACGDVLGATLEFKGRKRNSGQYLRDIVGGGVFNWTRGEWTDDTCMAVAVGRGIVERPYDPIEPIGDRFLGWLSTGPKDVGATTRTALCRAYMGRPWRMAGVESENAAGNGALMRTWPVALAYWRRPKDMAYWAIAISAMTHVHPLVRTTCTAFCWMLAECLAGRHPLQVFSNLSEPGVDAEAWNLTVAGLLRASTVSRKGIRSTGFTLDTLEAAVWAFVNTDSLEDCVVEAANLGGDADTVASVAGALAGAYYGSQQVPRRWREALLGLEELEALATHLYHLNERK